MTIKEKRAYLQVRGYKLKEAKSIYFHRSVLLSELLNVLLPKEAVDSAVIHRGEKDRSQLEEVNKYYKLKGEMTFSDSDKAVVETYARAMQDIMKALTEENSCGKSYDPAAVDLEEQNIYSYAFNLKNGSRHHPASDFSNLQEIENLMLKEAVDWITYEATRSDR